MTTSVMMRFWVHVHALIPRQNPPPLTRLPPPHSLLPCRPFSWQQLLTEFQACEYGQLLTHVHIFKCQQSVPGCQSPITSASQNITIPHME